VADPAALIFVVPNKKFFDKFLIRIRILKSNPDPKLIADRIRNTAYKSSYGSEIATHPSLKFFKTEVRLLTSGCLHQNWERRTKKKNLGIGRRKREQVVAGTKVVN
jgi:hypothetical protein